MNHLKIAVKAAIEAGKSILNIYNSRDFGVEIKGDNSPLTKADKISHEIISSHLSDTKISILSEEGKHIDYESRKACKYLWIIDPIDGTKEFIKRNGEFTVNIALIKDKKPILGVIFVPVSGVLYFSEKHSGSFKTVVNINEFDFDSLISNSIKIPLNKINKTYTVVASRSHMSDETKSYIEQMKKKYGKVNLISRGSSLKLCMVAEGVADCYPRFAPTMEWDTAAGQAICEHAGFKVIDLKTKRKMTYNRKNLLNNWFIVKK